jgi:hypothetical protein
MSFLFHNPRMRVFDDNGDPVPGAVAKFFESATTTPTPVYNAAGVSIGVEVEANAAGVFPAIYGNSSIVYRMQLYTAGGVLISDDDPIHPHVAFPAKTLMMFVGTDVERDAAYPPALWELADGDNGTPDTRDRAPIGVSNTKPIGTTGGTTGTVNTSSGGSHNHSGLVGSTILSGANMPVHNHRAFCWNVNGSNSTLDGFGVSGQVSIAGEVAAGGAYINTNIGATKIIEDAGTASPTGHDHTIGADGTHFHTVPANQSPYFTTWFLMRKP